MLRPCHSLVFTGALCAATLLSAAPAWACGGAFCSAVQPIPVEQNAERILFEVNPKGTISTTVEISYTGDPADFAWVVPVPSPPDLEVVPPDVLLRIDDATSPILSGQRTRCGVGRSVGCSTGGSLALAPVAVPAAVLGCAASGGGWGDDDDYDGVDVTDYDRVGPYEPRVVSSGDPEALIGWLNDNGYFVNEAMEPYIAEYVLSGSSFLAMRLAPEAGVSDIAPIRMTYPASAPQIPIILTAIAAEPEMAILAFVASDQRYQSGNYANVLMDPAWLRYDPSGFDTNYFAVASWLADQVGGHAFFTEYAGPTFWTGGGTNESQDWLQDLARRRPYLTRMYTRLSAWEMDEDPIFEPSAGGDVPNQIDLGGNEPVDTCNDNAIGTCGGTYCGVGAECASTAMGDACVCPEGFAARTIRSPGAADAVGAVTVTCQDLSHELFTTEDLNVDGSVCDFAACGDNGTCVDVNGFATCVCDEGYAAVGVSGETSPECVETIETFTPEEALVGGDMTVGFAALEERTPRRGLEILLGLAILSVPLLRRRR